MTSASNSELEKNLEAKLCELESFLEENPDESTFLNHTVASNYVPVSSNNEINSMAHISSINYENIDGDAQALSAAMYIAHELHVISEMYINREIQPYPAMNLVHEQQQINSEMYMNQEQFTNLNIPTGHQYSMPDTSAIHYMPNYGLNEFQNTYHNPHNPNNNVQYSSLQHHHFRRPLMEQQQTILCNPIETSKSYQYLQHTDNIWQFQPHENHNLNNHIYANAKITNGDWDGTQENLTFLTGMVPQKLHEYPKLNPLNKNTDKKYTKYCNNNYQIEKYRQHLSQWQPIDVNLQKLGIGPEFESCSTLLKLLAIFRQLSHYLPHMTDLRRTLQLYRHRATGHPYIPDKNYLPRVVKDISHHIKLVKQTVGFEFYESFKIINSINIYEIMHEMGPLNQKFHKEIENYSKYELVQVKHKNGMLLLPNVKQMNILSSLKNFILYVREYTIYLTIVKQMMWKSQPVNDTINDNAAGNPLDLSRLKNYGRRIGA